jgi:hypothetical protein
MFYVSMFYISMFYVSMFYVSMFYVSMFYDYVYVLCLCFKLLGLLLAGSTGQHMAGRNELA